MLPLTIGCNLALHLHQLTLALTDDITQGQGKSQLPPSVPNQRLYKEGRNREYQEASYSAMAERVQGP